MKIKFNKIDGLNWAEINMPTITETIKCGDHIAYKLDIKSLPTEIVEEITRQFVSKIRNDIENYDDVVECLMCADIKDDYKQQIMRNVDICKNTKFNREMFDAAVDGLEISITSCTNCPLFYVVLKPNEKYAATHPDNPVVIVTHHDFAARKFEDFYEVELTDEEIITIKQFG